MARGVAVLAVDSGGPSEFVANMQTGVLAPSPASRRRWRRGSRRSSDRLELRARLAAAGGEKSFRRDYTDTAMRARVFSRLESQLPAANGAETGVSATARSAPGASRQETRRAPSVPVTIVAHDVGAVGGMELTALRAGRRSCSERGHPVTVIRAQMRVASAGSRVEFRRSAGPKPAVPDRLPVVRAGGVASPSRAGGAGSSRAPARSRSQPRGQRRGSTAATRRPRRRARPAGSGSTRSTGKRSARSSGSPNGCACAATATPGSVCVSDGVAEEVRESFPAVAGRVRTIHNGVDTGEFAPGVAAAEGRELRDDLDLGAGRARSGVHRRRLGAQGAAPPDREGARPRARLAPGRRRGARTSRSDYEDLASQLGVAELDLLARCAHRRARPVYAAGRCVRAALEL